MFSRRAVLTTSGLAAFATMLGVNHSEAIVVGDGDEKKNAEIVKAMLDSWSSGDPDKVASFFTTDAAFRGEAGKLAKELPAIEGRDRIRASVAGVGKMAKVKIVVADTFARGSLVVSSHYQTFDMIDPAKGQQEDWYLGVFFLKDGKIQEWNDYSLIPFSQPRQTHPPQFGKFLRF